MRAEGPAYSAYWNFQKIVAATPDHAGGWVVEKRLLQKVTKGTKVKRGPNLCC
jgi:hypothetical protein